MKTTRRLLLLLACTFGCVAPRYRGPAMLATGGVLLGGGGGIAYAVGDRNGNDTTQGIGAASLAVGVALMMVGGIWAAKASQCDAQADCLESEYCQKLYTSAGPLGHCVAR